MTPSTIQHCQRCGTCCMKGGPALHLQDMAIIRSGTITPKHLITIRRGEPVLSPITDQQETTPVELVKITGQGREWTCLFFESSESSCGIYLHRPQECMLLKCWDTGALEKIIGRETLARFDIIEGNDPLLSLVKKHEEECSWMPFQDLLNTQLTSGDGTKQLEPLKELIRKDLTLRSQVVQKFSLSLNMELFYFGRPAFSVLAGYGVTINPEKL